MLLCRAKQDEAKKPGSADDAEGAPSSAHVSGTHARYMRRISVAAAMQDPSHARETAVHARQTVGVQQLAPKQKQAADPHALQRQATRQLKAAVTAGSSTQHAGTKRAEDTIWMQPGAGDIDSWYRRSD